MGASVKLNRRQAEEVLPRADVQAFLRVIREGESNQTDAAYTLINGGGHFDPAATGWRHPYAGLRTTEGGRAAGAHQFIPTTWAEVEDQLGLDDFSPRNQDLGAIARIAYRDALDDVLAGRIEEAIVKCRQEWTSLPGASENSGRYTMDKALAVYRQWYVNFSSESQPAAPIEDRTTPARPEDTGRINRKEAPVAPIIIPLLSAISTFVPALAKIFNDGSAKGQKIEALAPLLSDALVRVTGAVNLQDAAEKVQADPTAAQAAQKAVEDVVYHLSEVGGGIEAARKWSTDMAAMNMSVWRMPSFVITVILFPLIYFVVFIVLAGRGTATAVAALITTNMDIIDRIAIGFAISADMQNVVITAVIAGVLSGITGFFLGTSYGSQRKTDTVPR